MSGTLTGHWNWRRAVAESDLKSTTKHVLLTLSLFASDAGEGVFPSVSTLARLSSLTNRAVREHLKLAAEAGWIVRTSRFTDRGRQTSNEYELSAPGRVNEVQGEGEPRSGGEGERNDPPIPLNGLRKKQCADQVDLVLVHETPKADPNGGYTYQFECLWDIHPRGGKRAAFKAYLQAVPAKLDQQAAEDYLDAYVRSLRDGFKGAHLSTWLNQEYWHQVVEAHPQNGQPNWGRL